MPSFEVSIDMDKASGSSHLAEALHVLADKIEQDQIEPEGAGNVDDAEGETVGIWEVLT